MVSVILLAALAFWPALVARRTGHRLGWLLIFSLVFWRAALIVASLVGTGGEPPQASGEPVVQHQ